MTELTDKQLQFLRASVRGDWKVNHESGLIDVDGSVYASHGGALGEEKVLPISFGVVSGDFDVSYNELETIEGSPIWLNGNLNCTYNNLTNLKGMPYYLGKILLVQHNPLTDILPKPNGLYRLNINIDDIPRHALDTVVSQLIEYRNRGVKITSSPMSKTNTLDFIESYYERKMIDLL